MRRYLEARRLSVVKNGTDRWQKRENHAHDHRRHVCHSWRADGFRLFSCLTVLADELSDARRSFCPCVSDVFLAQHTELRRWGPSNNIIVNHCYRTSSDALYYNYIFCRRISVVAFLKSSDTDQPVSVVKCKRRHLRDHTFEIAAW